MGKLKILGGENGLDEQDSVKRLFFAIDLSDFIVSSVERLIETFTDIPSRYIRWVAPSNLHVSIKFLGEVESDKLPAICDVAEKVFASCGNMRLTVEGMGIFPNHDRPRVVWLGVKGETEKLVATESRLSEQLENLGFQADQRPYAAHLTIGRVKNDNVRGKLVRLVRKHHGVALGDLMVDHVSLYESKLKPGGAIYSVVRTFKLAGDAGDGS